MEGFLGIDSFSKEIADIFAEDSENDRTFYGFSDSENNNTGSDSEDGSKTKLDPSKHKETSSKHPFRLRVALRAQPSANHSTDDEEEQGKSKEQEERKKVVKSRKKTIKKESRVKLEEEEKPVALASPPRSGSDGENDAKESFLDKREQNIKANKAMLAQLLADLQKMPGGGEKFLKLKKQAEKKPKEKGSHPPRSGLTGGQSRRNPERGTRRQTRSMGRCEDSSDTQEREVELSLEEELLEVRGAPQRRGAPQPRQSKPHVIRPVEEITEDELQLVADNMTEKVYNRATGSTCHQCRQKTTDTKTCCRNEECRGIQGQFCGPCLRNRYGEDVKKALLDPDWHCPPCRGICNCSFCRQREGRCPTGILFPLARFHGFSDVHSYLSSLRNKLKNSTEDDL